MNASRFLSGLAVLAAAVAHPLAAQTEFAVEILASVLAAEDARQFDGDLFQRALADADSSVRRQAALALGRIRDSRALPLLTPLLLDPDSLVQTSAAFAMGLLGDTAALPALAQRARDPSRLSYPAATELITAAAKLGGPGGADIVRGVLERTLLGDREDTPYLAMQAALESWRLGARAPVDALLGMAQDPKEVFRYPAIYSLSRLRTPAAAVRLLEALRDRQSAAIRSIAARALTASYADTAQLAPRVVSDALVRATVDQDAGVRIQALRSLATFREPGRSGAVLPLLEDAQPNAQVQAAQALGELGGTQAVEALARIAGSDKGTFARRREALVSLSRLDSAAFAAAAGLWRSSPDWRQRAAAGIGWARIAPGSAAEFLDDPDGRVVAAVLQARAERTSPDDATLVPSARRLLASRDAGVRSVAADILAKGGTADDVTLLVQAVKQAARDSFPDATLSALGAIVALAAKAEDGTAVERAALAELPIPKDYLVRLWAESNWTAASEAWGPAFPLDANRTMEDYRGIVRRYLIGLGPERYPHVRVEVEQAGSFELELFGPEAPLTVDNFLRLADRRFYDHLRFHRVVPHFVVQAGDPRGDGWGGPGGAIRDEVNRRRYDAYVLGMASSGPETAASQWFVTLSQQPHLDGRYTVFGEVVDGIPALLRITQGDVIRSVRRQ